MSNEKLFFFWKTKYEFCKTKSAFFSFQLAEPPHRVVRDRSTGISRGFAFVSFHQEESAAAALSCKGPHMVEGRAVRVKEAERSKAGGGGGGGGGGGKGK